MGWTAYTAEQIGDYHRRTERLDPAFAQREREYYSTRTVAQLEDLARQAWLCNQDCRHALAMGYLALIQAPHT